MNHYAFTASHMQALPVNLRALIGKYFAGSRWQETCDFYNALPERYRATVCFHAGLKKRHTVIFLHELNDADRECLVNALDELRKAFAKHRRHEVGNIAYLQRLTISERKTLFMHAGLTAAEFNQPLWRIDDAGCQWRGTLLTAIRELITAFDDAPIVLTAIKPEAYIRN